jgi:hypothetical protein
LEVFKGEMGKVTSRTKSRATTGLYKPSGTHQLKPGTIGLNGRLADHDIAQFRSKHGEYVLQEEAKGNPRQKRWYLHIARPDDHVVVTAYFKVVEPALGTYI